MHLITRKRLNEFAEKHPDAKSSLARWYAIMRKGRFLNFAQLRETFPHADQVGKFTVFNIGGNKVRLVAAVHYNRNKIYPAVAGPCVDSSGVRRPANGRNNMSLAELEEVTKAWPPISRAVRVPHTDADYQEIVQLLD